MGVVFEIYNKHIYNDRYRIEYKIEELEELYDILSGELISLVSATPVEHHDIEGNLFDAHVWTVSEVRRITDEMAELTRDIHHRQVVLEAMDSEPATLQWED